MFLLSVNVIYSELIGEEVFDVERGKSEEIIIETLHIHKFSELTIPSIVIRGQEEGPRILFIAGIHGDELNGVAIVRRLIRLSKEQDFAGTVVAIPVVNVAAPRSSRARRSGGRRSLPQRCFSRRRVLSPKWENLGEDTSAPRFS